MGPQEGIVCLEIKAFPLQILLRRKPEWRRTSVGVVDLEKPQGKVLHLTSLAFRRGIRTGMRYTEALSFDPRFRVSRISESEIAAARADLIRLLHEIAMEIGTDESEPGVVWLCSSGRTDLSERARALLERENYRFSLARGFTRFGTYVTARSLVQGSMRIFRTPSEEDEYVRSIPLKALFMPEDLREDFELLGVETIGDYCALPAGGLLERFGREAYRLHRMASREFDLAPGGEVERVPFDRRMIFEQPENHAARLLFFFKRLLDELLAELSLSALVPVLLLPRLLFENGSVWSETLSPAVPTRDSRILADLLYLKLESLDFPAGVSEIGLEVKGAPAESEQIGLFRGGSRDPRAASEALARVRAEWGEEAVRWIRLTEGHLPEKMWEEVSEEEFTRRSSDERTPRSSRVGKKLVRRFFRSARPLNEESIEIVAGPYRISDGWWRPANETRRAYHFARFEGDRKGLFWVFRDEITGRWFLQGKVE